MKPVLVGIDPGPGKPGVLPLDARFQSGARVATLCGLSNSDYHDLFDRVNLYPHPDVDSCHDEEAGVNLVPILRGRRVVALGGRVASALGVTGCLEWGVRPGQFVGAHLPHPAGLNRWWNKPENTLAGKRLLRSILRPSVHVEGPDGSGKSTLVKTLSEATGLPVTPTDDPPDSHDECLRRVQSRILPGIICDRSSGLVSELVYGPVLRRGTIGPEEWYWDVVRAVIGAVVFVYCRPPVEAIHPAFRVTEARAHQTAVIKRAGDLLERYDYVMSRLSALGGQVIRYDWTRDTPEEVLKCVAWQQPSAPAQPTRLT